MSDEDVWLSTNDIVRVLTGTHRGQLGKIINIVEVGNPGEPIFLVVWDLPGGDCRTWYRDEQIEHASAVDRLALLDE